MKLKGITVEKAQPSDTVRDSDVVSVIGDYILVVLYLIKYFIIKALTVVSDDNFQNITCAVFGIQKLFS